MTLPKYNGREGKGEFRPMTFQEALELASGEHIWALSIGGDARRVKVNGMVRTWKRDPNRVEIPWKYGMYEYGVFTRWDVEEGRLLVEL